MSKSNVVIGFLGTKLDSPATRGDRWNSWRPSIGICQQQNFAVDRLDLLVERAFGSLGNQVARDIATTSRTTEVRLHEIALADPWDFEEVYGMLHEFTSAYAFDTDREDYFGHITTGTHVAQICMFLLTESRHLPGVLLQSSPSRPMKRDPRGLTRLIDLDLSRYDLLASRFEQEQQDARSLLKGGIETRNDHFNRMIERIEQVSVATRAPILLTGPTGAGKSQLAKQIFALKKQRQLVGGELVEVNCATIRGDQAMSALFGHAKGAFTGASGSRAGLLKSADGGVLFLDEIGELGADEQAMLLRAIEQKVFMPVGSDQSQQSDFQLLAGTNRDLRREVQAGNFRDDLLARINLWTFRLPGVAERREDIDPNIDFELAKFDIDTGRKVTINKEARRKFLEFALDEATPWKANFRDLNACITRMATLSPGGRITTDIVAEEIERLRYNWAPDPDSVEEQPTDDDQAVLASVLTAGAINSLDRFDRVQLAEVLRVCQSSPTLSAAGRELFQASRMAKQKPNDSDRLRKYLAKFSIAWADIRTP